MKPPFSLARAPPRSWVLLQKRSQCRDTSVLNPPRQVSFMPLSRKPGYITPLGTPLYRGLRDRCWELRRQDPLGYLFSAALSGLGRWGRGQHSRVSYKGVNADLVEPGEDSGLPRAHMGTLWPVHGSRLLARSLQWPHVETAGTPGWLLPSR